MIDARARTKQDEPRSLPGRRAFDDQVARLVQAGYPSLLGTDEVDLGAALEPLAGALPDDAGAVADYDAGTAPFVIVVAGPRAPVREMLARVRRRGREAIERLDPVEVERFTPIDGVEIPSATAYLLLGVDRGGGTLNVTPNEALARIEAEGRLPLTIEEGVALLTHHPEVLRRNHGFSLLASRSGDKRVPALWLSQNRPKLGWCWAGNPHPWLGSASCAARSSGVTR